MVTRERAHWLGWVGTALIVASWLAISWISSLSFVLWILLMVLGGLLCLYGALRCSKWFFLPGAVAVIVMAGGVLAALVPEKW